MKYPIFNIRKNIKNYIIENNLKSLVIGISGGIDSALVTVLSKPVCNELNIPLIGKTITIESNKPEEIARAKEIGEKYCDYFEEINLTELYHIMSSNINYIKDDENEQSIKYKIRNGNIKARLRMIYLYNLASKNNGMVLSTDNYTEYLMGFWTIHGDVGDYAPIQNLYKSEVYDMSKWLANNEAAVELINTINAVATDGLGITNSDLDQLLPEWEGTSIDGYAVVDLKLKNINNINIMKSLSDPVYKRYLNTQFKRKIPISISRESIFNK